MKNFDNIKEVLFDSTGASFKLAIESNFTRKRDDGTYRDLVYVASYTANLNPNIYLTFSYKSAEPQNQPRAVYMSYPQLYRLREAMEKIKTLVVDGSGFVEVDGKLTVKPGCDEPVNVTNIGKGNNWISFKLNVFEENENGVSKLNPSVVIGLSTSHPEVSILSLDEFLTVYSIVHDLDLATYQALFSLAFLDTSHGTQQMTTGYSQPAGQYQQSAQMPYQTYQQPAQVYYNPQPQQAYQGRQSYGNRNRQQYQQQVPPVPGTQEPAKQAVKPQQSNLPPRSAGNNLKAAIADTPVLDVDYDDLSSIDDIFNN